MTSAKAPEGRVNRNNGRLTATCTRDTVIGLASRLVINQPDAVSNIAVPTFETRLAVHITVNARWLNGPHREGAGSVGAAAVVRSALNRNPRAASHSARCRELPASHCPLKFCFSHGPLLEPVDRAAVADGRRFDERFQHLP